MADPVVDEPMAETGDMEMEVTSTAPENAIDEESRAEPDPAKRVTFLDYIRSPIIQLAVGPDLSATLSVHQDLLTKSPFFEQQCAEVGSSRLINLPEEDLDAVGSFVEYLYTGEYFPRRRGDSALESHPSIPDIDSEGAQLLRHARIYTLAEKLGMPTLKALAQRKIRLTTSTARGEIAYARYVYATTTRDDATIREPIAKFWATRSYVLRHDAEEEFRAMCLQYPQFGFDVLSKVLDQQEKARSGSVGGVSAAGDGGVGVAVETPTSARGRKRGRLSEIPT